MYTPRTGTSCNARRYPRKTCPTSWSQELRAKRYNNHERTEMQMSWHMDLEMRMDQFYLEGPMEGAEKGSGKPRTKE